MSPRPTDGERCSTCGVSINQVVTHHNEQTAKLAALIRRASPFVSAVAGMADNKTPALSWLADAAAAVGTVQPDHPAIDAARDGAAPHALWTLAEGDEALYREAMIVAGHLVPAGPTDKEKP